MLSRPLLLLFSLPLAWSRSTSTIDRSPTSSNIVVLSLADLEAGRVSVPTCALKDYRGTDNEAKWAVYLVSSGCSSEVSSFGIASRTLGAEEQLMWLSEMDVEPSVRAQYPREQSLNDWIRAQSSHTGYLEVQQQVFSQPSPYPWNVLHHDPASSLALVSIHRSTLFEIDTHMPRFAKLTAISSSPLSNSPSHFEGPKPVPDTSISRITALIDTLPVTPSPKVLTILSSLSLTQMRADIRWLTGEDPKSPIVSRHSFTTGARTAAQWLKEQFEASGAKCDLLYFLEGFAPNVRW